MTIPRAKSHVPKMQNIVSGPSAKARRKNGFSAKSSTTSAEVMPEKPPVSRRLRNHRTNSPAPTSAESTKGTGTCVSGKTACPKSDSA